MKNSLTSSLSHCGVQVPANEYISPNPASLSESFFFFPFFFLGTEQQLHSLYYESELLAFWTLTDTQNQHAKSRFTKAKTFRGVRQDDLMTLLLSAKINSSD